VLPVQPSDRNSDGGHIPASILEETKLVPEGIRTRSIHVSQHTNQLVEADSNAFEEGMGVVDATGDGAQPGLKIGHSHNTDPSLNEPRRVSRNGTPSFD
jgi:hypothetical protein